MDSIIGLKSGIVELRDHEKAWEEIAKQTINGLRAILGFHAADIRHIGSTAVKAIKAKPIVDIAVAVTSFEEVAKCIPELEQAGFHHCPQNDEPWQMYFIRGEDGVITHHIHIVRADSKEWLDYIRFRDYLNANRYDARAYEQLKLQLMNEYPVDRQSYTNGKAEYIQKTLRKAYGYDWLDKTVTVTVDRPMGSVHPVYSDTVYPVNYGCIKGIMAPDGEAQDAYVLGMNIPVKEFTGKVVGVIQRKNDIEDKLVVAPAGSNYHQAEIMEAVGFQEKYFESRLLCLYEKSCGAILSRKAGHSFEYLILFQHRSQTWSFPKGHAVEFESETQTALREIREEVGLCAEFIDGFRDSITYPISDKAIKEVVLFLSMSDDRLKLQEEEIANVKWVDKETAARLLVHKKYYEILCRAEETLKAHSAD